jgi:hypothetical protein
MFRLNCLILCVFFTLLAVVLACAQTVAAAPAVATPWWAELLTAALPALVIFITKEIRSHAKDQTIERIAGVAAQVKKYEPLAADVLTALEARYPVLKADVAKVETVIKDPVAQAALKAAEQVAANVSATPGTV